MADLTGTLSSGNSMTGTLGVVYGKDGKSAYEIALSNGFEGSEAEWVESLKGEQGERGLQGDPFTYDDFTQEQLVPDELCCVTEQFRSLEDGTAGKGVGSTLVHCELVRLLYNIIAAAYHKVRPVCFCCLNQSQEHIAVNPVIRVKKTDVFSFCLSQA